MTWGVELLPRLEQSKLFDVYSSGQLADAYVAVMICPSDGDKGRAGPVTSYVANGGRLGSAADAKIPDGVFHNRILNPNMATAEGHWRDGREYTLMLTESLNSTFFNEIGWNGFTGNGAPPDLEIDAQPPELIYEHRDLTWNPVFLWSNSGGGTAGSSASSPINSDLVYAKQPENCKNSIPYRFTAKSCDDNEAARARALNAYPSSYHPGGVNVVFGSGRATFLRESIENEIYQCIMTLNDERTSIINPRRIVTDNDL